MKFYYYQSWYMIAQAYDRWLKMNNINDDHQYYQNEQRLMDLEIENKILKNRYMKLKILKLEKNLGFDHCDEVKDLLINSNHQ